MANPNPKTDHLNHFPKRAGATEALGRTPVQVKILESQYNKWMSLPVDIRNQVLRDAIEKTLEKFDNIL
ncbi:hypothetical protein NIES4102_16120 [Chondrocystis sp. NIES-4102]|nr:hypothetical protein NIES4102_16120 [Chondrocystis sp. NIES-4102]